MTRERMQEETLNAEEALRTLEELLNNVIDNDPLRVFRVDPDPNPKDPDYYSHLAYQPLFENLQGNILKGHDRDYASHIFLRFRTDDNPERKDRIQKMIRERISKSSIHLTSAKHQFEQTKLYKRHEMRGKVFVNFFLSAEGYRALGFEELKTFDESFKQGMRASKVRLNDPDSEAEWKNTIHAMVLIADDDESYVHRSELLIIEKILKARKGDIFDFEGQPLSNDIDLAEVITVERGAVLRDGEGQPVEHFGYRDGISNPLFLNSDIERVNQFLGETNWNPWASLNLVLVPDPLDPNQVGSYLVFRKLEQNVREFVSKKEELAYRLKLGKDANDRAGSLAIGRYKEGTPTTKVEVTDITLDHRYETDITNDFTYENDPGTRCPLHAHIRNTNPRSNSGRDVPERRHRIVRRGITYGKRATALSEDRDALPQQGVGLLFMSYQRSMRDQFEHIQRLANGMNPDQDDQNIVGPVDPIIGQIKSNDPIFQKWPNQSGQNGPPIHFPFTNVITFKGGEYFFAPSISFLKSLGDGLTKEDPVIKVLAEITIEKIDRPRTSRPRS